MIPADRTLLRNVLRWARTNGWRPWRAENRRNGQWVWVDADWLPTLPPVDVRHVSYDGGRLTVQHFNGRRGWAVIVPALPVTTLQLAVDVLAAIDVLPAHLSSQHKAGRADAAADIISHIDRQHPVADVVNVDGHMVRQHWLAAARVADPVTVAAFSRQVQADCGLEVHCA